MTPLRRVQLRQPFHRQRVQGRDRVAPFPTLNIADRVVFPANEFGQFDLRQRHGFAQRAEFCWGHGSGRLIHEIIPVSFFAAQNIIAAFVVCPLAFRDCSHGVNIDVAVTVQPINITTSVFFGAPKIKRLGVVSGDGVEAGHLNLSSMGYLALMNTDYSENIGMASGNSEISRKSQSQIVTMGATQ